MKYLLAQVVQHHDVGIHVEEVVTVGRVFFHGPFLWFRALIGEHVITMFGLVIHTVKACHLQMNSEWSCLMELQYTIWIGKSKQCFSEYIQKVAKNVYTDIMY